jgi:hypothetical protein
VERIIGYWHDAGIRQVRTRRMSLGGGLVMCGRKADAVAEPQDAAPAQSAAPADGGADEADD